MPTTTEVLYRFDALDDHELDIILEMCKGPNNADVHRIVKEYRSARLAGGKPASIQLTKDHVRHIDWQLQTNVQLYSRAFAKAGDPDIAKAIAYYKVWGKVQYVIMEQASKANSGFIPKYSMQF